MQKALDQMNLQLHHVISDITSLTGLAIIDRIQGGERNPFTLAKLREGSAVNHKRTERIYRQEGLDVEATAPVVA